MTNQTRNALYAMLAPYLLGTLVLVLLPALVTIILSFQNYDALTPPTWAGLSNYKLLLNYRAFSLAAQNTIPFIVLAVPLRMITMLALALLFNRPRRGVRLFGVGVYLPMVVPDIAFALMWIWIFNPAVGPLNFLLNSLGLPTPEWMVDRNTFFWLLLIMSLFQVGEGFVVFLAALRDVPDEYYHAAAIDGATRWQSFRYVTLPLLRPWLTLLLFRDIIVRAPAVFTPAFVMMHQVRDDPTWFLPQMIYEEAFSRFRFGVSAAVMVAWLVITGLLFFLAFRVVRGWGYADEL